MPPPSSALPPAPLHLPDLTGAALAIAAGARLSVGPSGGLATRAPVGVRGDAARRFIDRARRTLRPIVEAPEARAAVLRVLAPSPTGWGPDYGCALLALLWAPALARLPSPLPLRRGHAAADAARFVAALRADVLRGPTWTDRHGVERWAARLHTGALPADLDDLDDALARLARAVAVAAHPADDA